MVTGEVASLDRFPGPLHPSPNLKVDPIIETARGLI